jgi:hypothetical protein
MADSKKSIDEILKEEITKRKPSLSSASLKAYVSTLKNLYYKVFPKNDFDIKKFSQTKTILDFLKDTARPKRKTILASLMNVCSEDKCDEYRKLMMEDSMFSAIDQKKQEKSETQKDNWIEMNQVKDIVKSNEEYFMDFLKMKSPTGEQIQRAQNYIILMLTTGEGGCPPRRSIDWTLMKWKNFSKENDNVYDGKNFIFNVYKTKKYNGTQSFAVPKPLKKILDKWITKIPESVDYLLFDSNLNPLSNVKLNQRLVKIFGGKKIGTSMLRHIFVTDKYKDIPALNDMLETSEKMAHNLEQHLEYIKK